MKKLIIALVAGMFSVLFSTTAFAIFDNPSRDDQRLGAIRAARKAVTAWVEERFGHVGNIAAFKYVDWNVKLAGDSVKKNGTKMWPVRTHAAKVIYIDALVNPPKYYACDFDIDLYIFENDFGEKDFLIHKSRVSCRRE